MDDLLMQAIMAFLGVLAFAALFKAPAKLWIPCGVVGMVAWAVYLVVLDLSDHLSVSVVTATLVLMVISRALAVLYQVPGTVFVVAGIFPLVPGVGIYYTVYYLIMKEMELAGAKGMETLTIAISLAVGILLSNIVPQSWYNKLGKLKHK